MNLPDVITHYYSRSDRPFQNLSDLKPEELAETLEKLNQRRADNPNYKRIFGKRYMDYYLSATLRQLPHGRYRDRWWAGS